MSTTSVNPYRREPKPWGPDDQRNRPPASAPNDLQAVYDQAFAEAYAEGEREAAELRAAAIRAQEADVRRLARQDARQALGLPAESYVGTQGARG